MRNKRAEKRAQVAVFIIVAIIIVALVAGFFILRNRLGVTSLPPQFQPIENYFLDCIKVKAEEGKNILGDKAGYIYPSDFDPGSEYSPFSNQLNFFGSVVPYWYYVAGNNIIREQVPSKTDMEEQLSRYIEENLECDFSDFEQQGYEVNFTKPKVSVKINELNIELDVTSDLSIARETDTARQTEHKTSFDTKLGRFYDTAVAVYNYEKQQAFLEKYSVDVLRLYAPVDGVEISCSPKIWTAKSVFSGLQTALEANVQAIKTKGSYYVAGNTDDKYFIVDVATSEPVRFLYSSDWPTRMEVWESKNGVMIAEPIGNQAGLGILGFCFVPYHFVYDIRYPVLVQVYDGTELFQFPVAVVVDKNMPRQGLNVSAFPEESELCNYKNTEVSVYTYDSELNPIEADIGFECLGESCNIGRTKSDEKEAVLRGEFPQCVNGFITARAEGYAPKRYLFSTNNPGVADIALDKLYNISFKLNVDSKETSNMAVISFNSEQNPQTVLWPEQKSIPLSEGQYNVSVYVYSDSSITIPATQKEVCNEVPKEGILGMFGATEEKCTNIDIPGQTLSNALAGGGKNSEYIVESQLRNGTLEISVDSIPVPKSVEDLQSSYDLLDASSVYLTWKEGEE